MELKFKAAAVFFCLALFTAASEALPPADDEPYEQSSEALQMIQERMESLSGRLGNMSTPPRIQGQINLPAMPAKKKTGTQPQTSEGELKP